MSEDSNDRLLGGPTRPEIRLLGNSLYYEGEWYPVSEWLTPAAYAQKYDLSIQTVISRMNRGSLPGDDVLEVEAWGLRLIRDQAHDPPARGPRRNERPT